MLKTKTFTDVLLDTFEKSIQQDQGKSEYSYSFNSGWESALDAYGMAQIMAQTPTFKFNHSQLYRYKKTSTEKPGSQNKADAQSQVTAFKVTLPPRPKHLMNETQTMAFQFLRSMCLQLPENFSFQQLKSAYRRAALKAHPDQGGVSETFQQVKKSYQILTALVKNEA